MDTPEWVWKPNRLTYGTRAVYAALVRYRRRDGEGKVHPSQDRLGLELHMSRKTVARHIRALADHGLVDVLPRLGRTGSDSYLVHVPKVCPEALRDHDAEQAIKDLRRRDLPSMRHPDPSTEPSSMGNPDPSTGSSMGNPDPVDESSRPPTPSQVLPPRDMTPTASYPPGDPYVARASDDPPTQVDVSPPSAPAGATGDVPRCWVCDAPLLTDSARAQGMCGSGDDPHSWARRTMTKDGDVHLWDESVPQWLVNRRARGIVEDGCAVCDEPLWSWQSKELGVCGKTGGAHDAAREDARRALGLVS